MKRSNQDLWVQTIHEHFFLIFIKSLSDMTSKHEQVESNRLSADIRFSR